MRNIIYIIGVVLLLTSAKYENMNNTQKSDTVSFLFLPKEEAKGLITTEDNYVRSLNTLDLIARLGDSIQHTKEEYLQLAADEVREWTEEERGRLNQLKASINDTIRICGYQIDFPSPIRLLKSDLKTESGAGGYTRSNWIALHSVLLQKAPEMFVRSFLLHETFHLLTRQDPGFKKRMYETIGFTVLDQEIPFPADLKEKRITNPDVDRFDSYATFLVNGQKQKCAMFIYADLPTKEGNIFKAMRTGFIALDDKLNPVQKDGETVVYDIEEISDFTDHVGQNTRYTINPEEILADNFAIAFLNRPSSTPELTEKIRNILLTKTSK